MKLKSGDKQNEHPAAGDLEVFLQGELSAEGFQRVVRHLLSGCEICGRTLSAGWPSGPSPSVTSRFRIGNHDSVTTEVLSSVSDHRESLRQERVRAESALDELGDLPLDQALEALEANEDLRTWGLARTLIDRCYSHGFFDAATAVELGELAVVTAMALDAGRYGAQRTEDLRAMAWAGLGNAKRICSDFRAAMPLFKTARHHLGKGTGDPIIEGRVLSLEASLWGRQGHFDKASELLTRVERIARRYGDRHLEGHALITRALHASHSTRSEERISLLRRGVEYIDVEQEPRLLKVAYHNLVLVLAEQGRFLEAKERLPELRRLHERHSERLDLLRLEGLEAQISAGLGDEEKAEKGLKKVRREMIAEGLGLDAAQVSLDLAALYFRQERVTEVKGLAEEMLPIFQSRDVHREAIAALAFFQKAAAMEEVSLALLSELGDYLERARNNPELRFRPEE